MRSAPQSLLLRVPCPVCGRPAREFSPCPWCGERAPAAPHTRGDVARFAAGLALLAVAAGIATATGTDVNPPVTLAGTTLCPVEPTIPAGMVSAVVGLLSGFFLVRAAPPRATPRRFGPLIEVAPIEARWGRLAAALLASFFALAFRACSVPYPIPFATRFAWMFPALAAACFALRVPAEAPNAPASGASPRERALRRHAPDLLAALSLAPFAAFFASCGSSLLSLVALSLVLGVWFPRLARPSVPLLLSALVFSLLLPDPAFFAFGLLARQLPLARP